VLKTSVINDVYVDDRDQKPPEAKPTKAKYLKAKCYLGLVPTALANLIFCSLDISFCTEANKNYPQNLIFFRALFLHLPENTENMTREAT
jgi:hypothetical protein